MATFSNNKLKLLLNLFDSHKILLSEELLDNGFSNDLIQYYKKSGWIKNIGKGVYTRPDVTVFLFDAIEVLQKKMSLKIHLGGKSCLSKVYNIQHFVKLKESKTELFCSKETNIPLWFKEKFSNEIIVKRTEFLKTYGGIVNFSFPKNEIEISTPERCFLEFLNYVPNETSVSEAREILELLVNIRPAFMQKLLQESSSVKVNRLFFYLSEKVNHSWFKYLKKENVEFGSGIREIEKGGHFVEKYNIIIKDSEI